MLRKPSLLMSAMSCLLLASVTIFIFAIQAARIAHDASNYFIKMS